MSDAKQLFIDEVMRLVSIQIDLALKGDTVHASELTVNPVEGFLQERIGEPVRYQQTDGKMVHSFLQPTENATDCIPLYRLDGGNKE